MKKQLLTLASLVFGLGQLMADTATFDAAALYQSLGAAATGVNVSLPYTWKASGSTVSVVINGTSGTQTIAANSITFRSGKSFTVTAKTGTVINKITIAATNATAAGRGSVDTGTYTTSSATGTWTPAEGTSPSEVTFTATANSFIVKTITVDYTVNEAPVAEPLVGPFEATPIENISGYDGNKPYVFDKSSSKFYALNNLNQYEEFGLYPEVSSLKVVGATSVTEIEYIKSTSDAYINLNYIPKANSRAVAVIDAETGGDWKAIYGCGYFNGGWKDRFCFFTTNATINLGGETGNRDAMRYNEKIVTVLDAALGTMEIYEADGTTHIGTITDSPKTADCVTPLYVFAQNKDVPGGGTQTDCYNTLTKLYSLQLYEGDVLVMDLVPIVNSEGKGGLKDKLTGDIFYSANSGEFELSPDGQAIAADAGITVYPGKYVINTTDNHEYNWNGDEWVDVGATSYEAITATNYQNMKREANGGGWNCRWGYETTFGNIENEGNNNYFNPYVGAGDWEPYQCTVEGLTEGDTYRVSFNFTSEGWNSWSSYTLLPFFVINTPEFSRVLVPTSASGQVLGYVGLTNAAVTNQFNTFKFIADGTSATVAVQFGVGDDGKEFRFHFDNLLIEHAIYPNKYQITTAIPPTTADNVEVWDGTSDAILGSIKYGGDSYKPAYTMTFDSGMGYSDAHFNQVFGEPANDENGKAWYETDYQMINSRTEIWNYNNTVLPNSWPGNMGEVYVRRYFKAEGELPAQLYMPAPHDDAPCEYYINGTLVWSRTGTEPGVNGWYEDEVVKLNDEQRALINTDGTVNVFAYHVHQNWGGRYADGGIYGNSMAENSPSARFENNENSHRLASAVKQAESVEGFPAELLAYAKNATVCLQDVNYALSSIRWELRKMLSPRHNYDIASAAPADGLECWLYNVGAGQFLAGGNDWGTHASLDYNISAWPLILRANSSGENRFAIQTNLPNGRRGGNDGLGHNGYVDCGYGDDFTTNEGWAWTFEAIGDGDYRIIQSGTDRYLGMTEDERYQVDTDKQGADNPYNHWKVITREQFDALAATATAENPADVSYYIHQNTFSQNDFDGNDKGAANGDLNDSKWERNAGSIWNWKGNDANGDYVYEMWNTAGVGKVYLKQVITGLPAGQYIVECTGYYRDGSWEDAIAGNDRQLAYFYAGSEDNSILLPSILDGANKGAGYGRINETMIPDGCNQAPRYFKLGTYTVQAPVVTVDNGMLEIGIYRDAEDVKERDWIVVDNFRLYCVGQSSTEFVTVGENLYATYVAPVDVDFTGAEVSAFAAQKQADYVHLEPVTAVPAGTAVVVKAEAAGKYAVERTTDAALGTENDLLVSEGIVADGTQFILAKVDDEVGFAKATPETTIATGKGYLVITSSEGEVKSFYGFEPDGSTGINAVEMAGDNAPIYNVAGQRIQKMQKGVNIVGSKKVLK